jgi:hypothetical protein
MSLTSQTRRVRRVIQQGARPRSTPRRLRTAARQPRAFALCGCTVALVADDEAQLISALMRAPLDRFIAARTEAVRELRKQGNNDAAARIAALRKPSVVVWALDQAGAVALDDLDTLRQTAIALRAAQEEVLAGDRNAASAMQRAAQQQRQQVDVLTRRLGMVLGASGRAAPEPTLRRISDSLRAASIADDDTWEALRDGRLLEELDSASFPAVDVVPAPVVHEQRVARESAAQRKRRNAAEAAVRHAESAVRAAREQEELAQRRREEATRELELARSRLAELDNES